MKKIVLFLIAFIALFSVVSAETLNEPSAVTIDITGGTYTIGGLAKAKAVVKDNGAYAIGAKPTAYIYPKGSSTFIDYDSDLIEEYDFGTAHFSFDTTGSGWAVGEYDIKVETLGTNEWCYLCLKVREKTKLEKIYDSIVSWDWLIKIGEWALPKTD